MKAMVLAYPKKIYTGNNFTSLAIKGRIQHIFSMLRVAGISQSLY